MNSMRVVEIGGTHIRRADVKGDEIVNLTRERTAEVLVGDILASLDNFCRKNWHDDIEALIILIAGPVRDNIVARMPNFPNFPHDINLTQKLNFPVPILVFNDMTAAVTGMAKLFDNQQPFWGLTWSTGLGGKFWDGEKISVDTEIGHDVKINDVEAEQLLGGRHIAQEAGCPPEKITDQNFYLKKAELMGRFLAELDKIAPSNLYVFKGAIAKSLLPDPNIQAEIKKSFDKDVELMLSPEPEKDSFIGAAQLATSLD